jgi:hypothetical protein
MIPGLTADQLAALLIGIAIAVDMATDVDVAPSPRVQPAEAHHISPQHMWSAAPCRAYLSAAGINPATDRANIVVIPYAQHRSIYTAVYVSWVNAETGRVWRLFRDTQSLGLAMRLRLGQIAGLILVGANPQ